MQWLESSLFTMPYIVVGDWKLNGATNYPHVKYLGADTETKLYLDGKQVDDNTVYELYKQNGQSWIKENLEVRAYAYQLSDGTNFACFQCAEDFLTAIAMFNAKMVFWYNAKFDFAIFDYYFLTNGWTEVVDRIDENNGQYRKLQDKTYESLNGDYGQRYQMRIWKKYKNRRCQWKTANFKFVDVCNIYGGGLAKNLEDWKIVGRDGKDVRKLTMQYDNASFDNDLQYMINDTKGLYLLAEKIDKTLKDISGYSLFNGDFITAGGLAKKALLEEMFKQGSQKKNIDLFKQYFPITTVQDKRFREDGLYIGGKCLVNPYKVNIVQHNVYKYDVNSMYPKQMRDMYYPFGKPKILETEAEMNENKLHIFKIFNFCGTLKPKMIPIWQDHYTKDYNARFLEVEDRYIWEEELEELKHWYNLSYEVIEILEYDRVKPKGAIRYIDKFYDIKCNSKGAIKQGAKLFLNSAYGKLAQRIERVECHYELAEQGYVHLVQGETEVDENSMLSVVVGSRVTALARVMLMQYIRATSQGDVAKNFIYCDTDSVHTLCPYDDTDSKILGKMKNEGIFTSAIYLAPKSYLMFDNQMEERNGYEVHCKGVNVNVVMNEIKKCKSFDEALEIFRPNRLFKCLVGINVKGGKALIYADKMILRDENLKAYKELATGLEDYYEQGDY